MGFFSTRLPLPLRDHGLDQFPIQRHVDSHRWRRTRAAAFYDFVLERDIPNPFSFLKIYRLQGQQIQIPPKPILKRQSIEPALCHFIGLLGRDLRRHFLPDIPGWHFFHDFSLQTKRVFFTLEITPFDFSILVCIQLFSSSQLGSESQNDKPYYNSPDWIEAASHESK